MTMGTGNQRGFWVQVRTGQVRAAFFGPMYLLPEVAGSLIFCC